MKLDNLKSRSELKNGECKALVRNTKTGNTRMVEAKYVERLNVVIVLYKNHEEILGYVQEEA